MEQIEIYTIPTCPFCRKAKELLEANGLDYNEYDISRDEDHNREKLGKKFNIPGRTTVPQIVINGKHIGGYQDLKELFNSGKIKEYL